MLGTLLLFHSLEKPTVFDALPPGERRRYLEPLLKKRERRQAGKKVNKLGLFMFFVVSISGGAMLAQSASNGSTTPSPWGGWKTDLFAPLAFFGGLACMTISAAVSI